MNFKLLRLLRLFGLLSFLNWHALIGAAEPKTNSGTPHITHVCLVAPDILAIDIESGKIIPGKVEDYVPVNGDEVKASKDKKERETNMLLRDGKALGELVGAGDKRQLIIKESFVGDELKTELADDAATYLLRCADDPNYAAGAQPSAVHRKSKPIDYRQMKPPARHTMFLHLPKPLAEGKTYQIECAALNLQPASYTFRNDTRSTRSVAVHTSQIGYRADDPFKRAYSSTWLGVSKAQGSSSVCSYPDDLKFRLLDDATGAEMFSGPVEMAKRASDKEHMNKEMNFNGTDVLRMDFSNFAKPGRYRLYVDGIGCGYPFVIDAGADTWAHAFKIQIRGFFHQRSGIALGPPYTTFKKPRDHHPDDGVEIIRSTWFAPIWSEKVTKAPKGDIGKLLKDGATGERVANGWGGYHDAGDWNPRRVTHMRATLAQLELADLFPDFFAQVKLNIPQDYKVPDVFNEALFEIDCFRRMQTIEGGIGYGLETQGDPTGATVSWHSKVLPVYMASPDAGNSWYYAAVAARVARLLQRYDANLAKVYADSAAKAMVFAETEFARQSKEKSVTAADLKMDARDHRNLAAIEMLRLTGDKHWHDIFMENTVLTKEVPALFVNGKAAQSDAAFAYATADTKLTDPIVRKRAIEGLELLAKAAVAYADGNAFDIVADNKYRPMFMGFYSTPWCGHVVLRAFHLTGNQKYLAAGIRACQFSSGANPENLVFTTGLGSNPIRNPLKLDSRISGQPAPEGITVYGIEDHVNFPSTYCYWILPTIDSVMHPKYTKWPVTESYTDTYLFVAQNEFTTDIWYESTWTWGYLAARPKR